MPGIRAWSVMGMTVLSIVAGTDSAPARERRIPAARGSDADPNQEASPPPPSAGSAAGRRAGGGRLPAADDFLPLPDRWRIGFPDWDRYAHGRRRRAPYTPGRWYDPYHQNVLKGDYPIIGDATFLNLTILTDVIGEGRRLPTPSGISAATAGSEEFFGDDEEIEAVTNLLVSADLFHGAAAFRPVDWRVRLTPVFNVEHLSADELGIVNIDVRAGTQRTDRHIGLQEGFVEAKLFDVSPHYDIVSLRLGIQGFLSDFRGFIFSDNELGARLFGNWASNRSSWNLAYFKMIEKDTNSGLNTNDFQSREQEVFIANIFRQDFLVPGYDASLSVHVNNDAPSVHFDKNGFLVRPAAVGALRPHDIGVTYLGWTGSGHVGRLNLTHALYHVSGDDSDNPIAGGEIDVNAWMGAAELSVDKDWIRYRVQLFWASGDKDPRDEEGEGFDTIFDNPRFAGAGTSFWVREEIPLTGTKVVLVGPNSLVPSLRSSKDEGQANFVNPGLLLIGAGVDIEVTPTVRASANVNAMRFEDTSSLELLLFQSDLDESLGVDVGIGAQWRPWLNNNFILSGSASTFIPGDGFDDIYTGRRLYSVNGSLTLVY